MARQAFDPMTILANNPFYLGAPNTPVPKWTTDSLGRRVRTQAFTDPKAVTPEALTGKAYGFTPDSNIGAQEVLDMASGNQGFVGRPPSMSEAWNQAQGQAASGRPLGPYYDPERLSIFQRMVDAGYDRYAPGPQPITMPDGTVAYPGTPLYDQAQQQAQQHTQQQLARIVNAAQNFRPQQPSGQSGGQTNPLNDFVVRNLPGPPSSTGPTYTPPSAGGGANPNGSNVIFWQGGGRSQVPPSNWPRGVPEGPGRPSSNGDFVVRNLPGPPSTTGPRYTPPSAGGNRMRNYRLSRRAGTPSGSNSIGAAFQKATIGR